MVCPGSRRSQLRVILPVEVLMATKSHVARRGAGKEMRERTDDFDLCISLGGSYIQRRRGPDQLHIPAGRPQSQGVGGREVSPHLDAAGGGCDVRDDLSGDEYGKLGARRKVPESEEPGFPGLDRDSQLVIGVSERRSMAFNPSLPLFIADPTDMEENVNFDFIDVGTVDPDLEIRRIDLDALALFRGKAFAKAEVLLRRRRRYSDRACTQGQKQYCRN